MMSRDGTELLDESDKETGQTHCGECGEEGHRLWSIEDDHGCYSPWVCSTCLEQYSHQ